jgi:hypothetical protein
MTAQDSDAKLRKILCPGCYEEMAREELIGTRCPLCGYRFAQDELEEEFDAEESDEDLSWVLTQNLQRTLIDWLMEFGASPLTAYSISQKICCLESVPETKCRDTSFSFQAKMTPEEKTAEKVCAKCGGAFVSGGSKIVSGDLFDPEPVAAYYCGNCTSQ